MIMLFGTDEMSVNASYIQNILTNKAFLLPKWDSAPVLSKQIWSSSLVLAKNRFDSTFVNNATINVIPS